jgi:hypothetical protein
MARVALYCHKDGDTLFVWLHGPNPTPLNSTSNCKQEIVFDFESLFLLALPLVFPPMSLHTILQAFSLYSLSHVFWSQKFFEIRTPELIHVGKCSTFCKLQIHLSLSFTRIEFVVSVFNLLFLKKWLLAYVASLILKLFDSFLFDYKTDANSLTHRPSII